MPYVPTGGGGSVAIGGTVTSATAGSVFFAGALGVLAQDNAGFFYEESTNSLILEAASNTDGQIILKRTASYSPAIQLRYGASNGLVINIDGGTPPTAYFEPAGRLAFAKYGDPGELYWDGRAATTDYSLRISPGAATKTGLLVNLAAAQSADAIRVKDSGSADVFVVNAAGSPGVRVNSAPADGDIDSNQLFWWFDSTDGAAKAKFKGKSANGTVVSGEVALA